MNPFKLGFVAAAKWLEVRLRRLFALAVAGYALYILGRALADEWGQAVQVMAALTLGMLLSLTILSAGVLFGVALLDRLRQGRPVVGALPDVVQAATVGARIARGEPTEEPVPPPFLPSDQDEEQAKAEAEARAMYEHAMQMVERMVSQQEEVSDNG